MYRRAIYQSLWVCDFNVTETQLPNVHKTNFNTIIISFCAFIKKIDYQNFTIRIVEKKVSVQFQFSMSHLFFQIANGFGFRQSLF